jgi:nitrogen fixation-related uncharacterized protein
MSFDEISMKEWTYESNLILAALTSGFITSTVFFWSLKGDQIWKNGTIDMSFLGSELLLNIMMTPGEWFLFTLGVSTVLVAIAITKIRKYFSNTSRKHN